MFRPPTDSPSRDPHGAHPAHDPQGAPGGPDARPARDARPSRRPGVAALRPGAAVLPVAALAAALALSVTVTARGGSGGGSGDGDRRVPAAAPAAGPTASDASAAPTGTPTPPAAATTPSRVPGNPAAGHRGNPSPTAPRTTPPATARTTAPPSGDRADRTDAAVPASPLTPAGTAGATTPATGAPRPHHTVGHRPATPIATPAAVPYDVLRVGACFDIDRAAPGTVVRRSCTAPHDAQLVARLRLTGRYADDTAVRDAAAALCKAPLRLRALAQPFGTRWATFVQYPYRTSYLLGDKVVACSLAAPSSSGRKLTAPLR
ncbi:hypothetical protein [Streptomyces sp. NPDC090025]|uniref:hypothetical protein n=1 Tax=Streptomyces sp. NPDC090025 TaxID=3365922 RepID=UPI0038397F52